MSGLDGVTAARVFDTLLAPLHPNRRFIRAYKEKRWDGRDRLYRGTTIPAGFAHAVAAAITEELGKPVKVTSAKDVITDPSVVTSDYLPPLGSFKQLWPHQQEAAQALIGQRRGIVKSATGSGKTLVAACVAKYFFEQHGWRTLVITSRRGLAKQTANVFKVFLKGIKIGQCGDGKKETDADIVISTGATIAQGLEHKRGKHYVPPNPELERVIRDFEVIIGDELHHASSTSWYDVLMASGAYRRYGMSGTPLKQEEWADVRVIAATGPILYDAKAAEMIEEGLAARPVIAAVMAPDAFGPDLPQVKNQFGKMGKMPYAQAYVKGVVKNKHLNRSVIRAVEWLYDRNKQTLVMCRRLEQLQTLAALCEEHGLTHLVVQGQSSEADRSFAKRQMEFRKARIVIVTEVWGEGEDVKSVDALVLAEGVKVSTSVLQRIGRGMRQGGRDLWVVDFVPTNHATLRAHAQQRLRSYKAEGFQVIPVTDWPAYLGKASKDLLPFEAV